MRFLGFAALFFLLIVSFSPSQAAAKDGSTTKTDSSSNDVLRLRLGRYAFHISSFAARAASEEALLLKETFSDRQSGVFIIRYVEGVHVVYNEFNGRWFALKNAFLQEMSRLKAEYKESAEDLEETRALANSFEKQNETSALTRKMKTLSDQILALDKSKKGAESWWIELVVVDKEGRRSMKKLLFDKDNFELRFEGAPSPAPRSSSSISPLFSAKTPESPVVSFYYLVSPENVGKFYDKKNFIAYNLGLNPKGRSLVVFLTSLGGVFQIFSYDYRPYLQRNSNVFRFGGAKGDYFLLEENKAKKTMTFRFYDKDDFLLLEAAQKMIELPKGLDLALVAETPVRANSIKRP